MTVSRVISGHPYVRPSTARKVNAAIRKLSYRPSQAARILGGMPSNTIGLIVPDLKDHFFATIANEVQETAHRRNYTAWVVSSNSDIALEQHQVNQMLGHHFAGIILIPTESKHPYLKSITQGPTPFLSLDQPITVARVDSIETDNREASEHIVKHLITHGRKRIVCLGYNEHLQSMQNRILGYENIMKQSKLRSRCVFGMVNPVAASNIIEELLHAEDRPDAFFTINNVTTTLLMEALRKHRISIPSDIALVGFDDPEHANLMYCPPTVMRQPIAEFGRMAVQCLIDRILDPSKDRPIKQITLPAEMVIRSSCGCVLPE